MSSTPRACPVVSASHHMHNLNNEDLHRPFPLRARLVARAMHLYCFWADDTAITNLVVGDKSPGQMKSDPNKQVLSARGNCSCTQVRAVQGKVLLLEPRDS